jgi:serine/threonine protein kinase
LKIADFDLSFIAGDNSIKSLGTKNYRAPELIVRHLKDPKHVDIYSLGIILYFMVTGGLLPFEEDDLLKGDSGMYAMLHINPRKFWREKSKNNQFMADYYTKDFKTLFAGLVTKDPKDRYTIDDIIRTKWYNGPIYTTEELELIMGSSLLEDL